MWQACMKKYAHYSNYLDIYLFASFSTKLSIQCASNLDKEGWTGGVQVCIQRKGHDWSILQSQTMEKDLSSQYSAISYYQTLLFCFVLFFFSDIQGKSIFGVFLCVFCADIYFVEFITLLESVEKSFFSVTVLLLLLILFYYSVNFL